MKKTKLRKFYGRCAINMSVLKNFLSKVFGGACTGILAGLKPCCYTKHEFYHSDFYEYSQNRSIEKTFLKKKKRRKKPVTIQKFQNKSINITKYETTIM